LIADDTEERYDFDDPPPLALDTTDGPPMMLAVSRIDITSNVVLRAVVDTAAFATIHDRGLFHLEGESMPHGWEDDLDVELTLRLDDTVASSFDDGETLVRATFAPDPTPLRSAESWYLLEAVQSIDVPGLPDATTEIGLQTHWATGGG
jgi:hypothetical protein